MQKARKRFFLTAMIVVTLGLLELTSFVGVAVLRSRNPVIFYAPQIVGREEYGHYLQQRDTLVGWPAPSAVGKGDYDATGSRVIPAYRDPSSDTTLLSLYGDSMTFGLEVDSAAAWSNQLAMLIGGRVANFGKAGFGTDQAFLYFLRNTDDKAKVVFLSHYSEDIIRNVNQFLPLFAPGTGHELGFKPRFVADETRLQLVPLPALGYDEYVECCKEPATFLKHEFFIPDNGISGVQTPRFPFMGTIVRLWKNHVVRPKLLGIPRHMDFYQRDHPSNALWVTAAIMREFRREATSRGKRPVLAIIPDGKDLEYYQRNGQWSYQPLLDELNKGGSDVLNFGTGLVERLNGRSPCEIIHECYNHFNAAGYRMIAEIAYDYLKQKGLLKEIGK